MNAAPFAPKSGRAGSARARLLGALGCAWWALMLVWAPIAHAGPFIWDEDDDRIDDRIESVNLLGYRFAFENADSLARERIQVVENEGQVLYSIYVVFDHTPQPADFA